MNTPYTISEIKDIAVPLAQQYGVDKLALFGSYARGEQRADSDVDFLIDKGAIRGIKFFGFVSDLEENLGTPVDVVNYEDLKNSVLLGDVTDEVVLYERSR
ncbi:MAG: nucleotidyltransferase domain-containing protein [Oscillospiraceae bacterium]|jgi:predicted nucleotidyltransferase|nr:nucleotidyltransferase domain-containing protein [Oscillospiraceae bacterium]